MRYAIPVFFIACCIALTGIVCLSGCMSSKTATINVTNRYSEDMVYIPENERVPEPEPVPTTYTVKAGDSIESDSIKIKKVTSDSVTVHMEWFEYSNGRDNGQTFTIKLGEAEHLTMMGLLDATSTTIIEVVSIE